MSNTVGPINQPPAGEAVFAPAAGTGVEGPASTSATGSQAETEAAAGSATAAFSLDRIDGQRMAATGRAMGMADLGLNEPPAAASSDTKRDDGWKVRFYFGMNRTHYASSDVRVRSPIMNVDIQGLQWQERTSAAYYNPAEWRTFQNAFQWIDEPTNTFVLSASKGPNEFMFSAFHPKYLMASDQQAHVSGEVGGVPIDGDRLVNPSADNASQPDAFPFSNLQNTHMQMDFQVGYGREFELFRTRRNTSMVYRPAIYAGVMMGKTRSSFALENGEAVSFEDRVRVHGPSAAIGNKLELRIRDRVSLMAEYKVSGAMMTQRVLGGTARYNLLYTPLHFGVGVKLWDQDRHRPQPDL